MDRKKPGSSWVRAERARTHERTGERKMKTVLTAATLASVLTLAGSPSAAAERCAFSHGIPPLIVRYPIHHDDGNSSTHTNKHIEWTVSTGADATPGEILGYENPAVVAVGDFVPGGGCDLLWETGTSPNYLAVTSGFTQQVPGGEADLIAPLPPPWQLAGAFDFTGDGMADLLWWNPET